MATMKKTVTSACVLDGRKDMNWATVRGNPSQLACPALYDVDISYDGCSFLCLSASAVNHGFSSPALTCR